MEVMALQQEAGSANNIAGGSRMRPSDGRLLNQPFEVEQTVWWDAVFGGRAGGKRVWGRETAVVVESEL